MATLFFSVKDLPDAVVCALKACGYARRDIAVVERNIFRCPEAWWNGGTREFGIVVSLGKGTHEWVRSNPVPLLGSVERCEEEHCLSPGEVLVEGTEGRSVHARVLASPDTFRKWSEERTRRMAQAAPEAQVLADLAQQGGAPLAVAVARGEADQLSDLERTVLGWYRSLTSAGRKAEIERVVQNAAWGASGSDQSSRARYEHAQAKNKEIADAQARLVALGLLKSNKAGAMQITMAGKNAVAVVRGY